MFIRGNGLNSWLRQSPSLLALQKKSAQVFFISMDVAYCCLRLLWCALYQAPLCAYVVTSCLMSLFSLIPVFLINETYSDNVDPHVRIIPWICVCLSPSPCPLTVSVPAISWAGFSAGEPANGDFCVASACSGCRWGSKWKSQIWPNAQRQRHARLQNSSRHR